MKESNYVDLQHGHQREVTSAKLHQLKTINTTLSSPGGKIKFLFKASNFLVVSCLRASTLQFFCLALTYYKNKTITTNCF